MYALNGGKYYKMMPNVDTELEMVYLFRGAIRALAPIAPDPAPLILDDPMIDPSQGREPREERREGEAAREAAATLILNRKIKMYQRKMRRLYLVEDHQRIL